MKYEILIYDNIANLQDYDKRFANNEEELAELIKRLCKRTFFEIAILPLIGFPEDVKINEIGGIA